MWPLHFIGTVYLTDEYECNGVDVSILLLLLHAIIATSHLEECAWEDICFDNFSNMPVICAMSITSSIFHFHIVCIQLLHFIW